MHWYALQVRPQYEKRVADSLERFDAFYPFREVNRRLGKVETKAREAFFPGYVFARFETHRHLPPVTSPQGWRLVSETPIPEIEIESVKILAASKCPWDVFPYLRVGEKVRITTGSLQGLEGMIVRAKEGSLLVVSIHAAQLSIAAELPPDVLEPVARRDLQPVAA